MASAPLVSLVMPVYNTAAFVGQAIQSVLNQTWTDWELIIVDDGSTDGAQEVVRGFSDARIRFQQNDANQGVSRTLNRAMGLARGAYIARHDSDDCSMPERLALQVEFLEANPLVGILGSYATTISADGHPIGAIDHHPVSDAAIRFASYFDSPFVSSTVVFRRSLLERTGGFDEAPERPVWDDYDMWSRLVRVTKAANLPLPLLRYRMLTTGLTGTTKHAQEMVREQRRRNILAVLPDADARSVELVALSGKDHPQCSTTEFRSAFRVMKRMVASCRPSASEQKTMLAEVRQRMLSMHVLRRGSLFGRISDKAYKELLLAQMMLRG